MGGDRAMIEQLAPLPQPLAAITAALRQNGGFPVKTDCGKCGNGPQQQNWRKTANGTGVAIACGRVRAFSYPITVGYLGLRKWCGRVSGCARGTGL